MSDTANHLVCHMMFDKNNLENLLNTQFFEDELVLHTQASIYATIMLLENENYFLEKFFYSFIVFLRFIKNIFHTLDHF